MLFVEMIIYMINIYVFVYMFFYMNIENLISPNIDKIPVKKSQQKTIRIDMIC